MLVRLLFLYFILLVSLDVKAQHKEALGLNNRAAKTNELFAEVLTNLANRKDNMEENGAKICVPGFSKAEFYFVSDFINEGGLNQLTDSTEWMFVKDYLKTPENLQLHHFDKVKVKNILKSKGIKLSEHSGLRTGFTPFF